MTWITLSTGVIVPPGAATYSTLTGKAAAKCESGIARWGDPFRAWGLGVDWKRLIAMAYQESGFNPNIMSGFHDGGVGLFQITNKALKGGHTDEQLKDPQLNTTIAANYILDLQRRYGADAASWPKISAAFNAGSVRPDSTNRWNMHCTAGHIDSEVACLNYCILRDQAQVDLTFDSLDPLPGGDH